MFFGAGSNKFINYNIEGTKVVLSHMGKHSLLKEAVTCSERAYKGKDRP